MVISAKEKSKVGKVHKKFLKGSGDNLKEVGQDVPLR